MLDFSVNVLRLRPKTTPSPYWTGSPERFYTFEFPNGKVVSGGPTDNALESGRVLLADPDDITLDLGPATASWSRLLVGRCVPSPSMTKEQWLASAVVDVEMRHLRYFVAVAEEASFTSAARPVHVAQQVLSTQVRQLEAALGVQLLERNSRGVTLTPAGRVFVEGARETLRTLERAAAAAGNTARAVVGQLAVGLRIGAVGVGGGLPARLLEGFGDTHPHVEVSMRTFDVTCPAAGLLDRGSDVAFVIPPVEAVDISLRTIATEPRVFVLPANHSLARRKRISLADVAGIPWVAADVATDGCDPTAWRDGWLVTPRPAGHQVTIGATGRTVDEFREHIIAGRGIMLCPASGAAYHARPELAFVEADGVPPVELSLAWRTENTNPIVLAFIHYVMGVTPTATEVRSSLG